MRKLIKHGHIVTESTSFYGDILIENEKIIEIATDIEDATAEIINANGNYVIPGGIDPHTHLDMPFGGTVTKDDFETGTRAAAFGGTTTIIDFCLTEKGKTLQSALQQWHEKANNKASIDYGFHLMISEINEDVLHELDTIVKEEGVTSFKVFMAYKNVLQADDGTLYKTLLAAKELGALVMVHAENGDVIDYLVNDALEKGETEPIYHALTRPSQLEGEATGRAAVLAELTDSRLYVVHVTCAEAVEHIVKARNRGIQVWGETCPQYITLDVSYLEKPNFEGAKYVWSPPLREASHQQALWEALASGGLQTIGSDQCSFDFVGQKELGRNDFSKIPNGGPMIEDRMRILFSEGVCKKRITMNQYVELTSTNSAKLFGLYPQKGTLQVGSDADIVILNPNVEDVLSVKTHHMAVDYNAFEGMKVTGKIETVMLRGTIIVENDTFKGKSGEGRFLKRKTFLSKTLITQ
ncbi:MAG: dihydropyrimidinase [Bacillaceae bacterium]